MCGFGDVRVYTAWVVLASLYLAVPVASAQESLSDSSAHDSNQAAEPAPHFGGPSSVGGTLNRDAKVKAGRFKDFFDAKARIKDEHGFSFGVDYFALYQKASESPGEDDAAGGVLRLYGNWELVGRGSKNTGSLVFKVENRHRLGTDIAPQDLGFEVGYVGLTAVTFSDIGWALTNLYWQQQTLEGRFAFVAGLVDTSDYIDVYGLVDPWSDFSNLAFSTNPTIPLPDQGIGVAVRGLVTENIYVLGGVADLIGDPTDPWGSVESFFDTQEYFTHLEFGWLPSIERRFTDNAHITVWHADERSEEQLPSGWGASISWNRLLNKKWNPFVRAGYADEGGSLWERSFATGIGRHLRGNKDLLLLGLSWGKPTPPTDGSELRDQYTVELLYRWRVARILTLAPDLQLLIDPALNPEEDQIWVVGVRGRLSF